MKRRVTQRGFGRIEFEDSYGEKCSIQESSVYPHLWLGVDRPEVKRLTGVPGVGWVDVELPEGSMVSGWMHLSVEQVAELIPILTHFVETEQLPKIGPESEEGAE